MASTVWLCGNRSRGHRDNTLSKIDALLAKLDLASFVKKDALVAIKTHFGELGNDAFIGPVNARRVADAIRSCGAKPFFADTNTLYSGGRHNAVEHLGTAASHGFVGEVCGAPVIIADGLKGNDWREVPLRGKWFDSAKIASAFLDADAMIVLSHFKGHEMAGFGGAIKNLAMGCAPPAGKRDQHSPRFFVRDKKCVGCGECVKVCPEGAPSMKGSGKAEIDRERCIGCGECALACPSKAITMDWNVELAEFTEKMVEYAAAAAKPHAGRIAYLSFAVAISPECDCAPYSDAPLVADLGLLASLDPVALDQACFDLVKAAPAMPGSMIEGKAGPGDDKFAAAHPDTKGTLALEYAERMGLGSRNYELERLT
jgi:hypothetical protein